MKHNPEGYGVPSAELIHDMITLFHSDDDRLLSYRIETERSKDNAMRWVPVEYTFIGTKGTVTVDANTEMPIRTTMLHDLSDEVEHYLENRA